MNRPVEKAPLIATERLRKVRDHLLTGLVERDLPIRLALLAALTGEHLLMVGPPGTAKSLVARRLHEAFADTRYFERLLTRFSVPEELFGPLSIKGLEQDRYERLTDAYLPTASIAFLDEVFKANSAILNSLLTLLNEREFDNGTQRIKTPLVAVIGASNELPEGEELDALFDRFLLRLHVGPVSADGFAQLLTLKGSPGVDMPEELKLTAEELRAFQAQAESVALPPEIIGLLGELRGWCAEQQLMVSDRRWRKIVKLLQTSALTNGRAEVSIWDVWLLPHCLWSNADQRAAIEAWYSKRVGATQAAKPERLIRQIVALEGILKDDLDYERERLRSQARSSRAASGMRPATSQPGAASSGSDDPRRFLAPSGAKSSASSAAQPVSRDNGGAGYTLGQLDRLFLESTNAFIYFHSWSQREAYLSDPANLLSPPPSPKPTLDLQHTPEAGDTRIGRARHLAEDVSRHRLELEARLSEVKGEVGKHLWITDDFVGKACAQLLESIAETSALNDRLIAVISEFVRLRTANQAILFDLLQVAAAGPDDAA